MESTMSDRANLDEQLSALADGELGQAEAELLLARLTREPALRARWERYHTIGEALRGGLPARYPVGLPAGVERALAEDVVHAARGGTLLGRFMMPMIGAAIAASVALVGVLVVRNQVQDPVAAVAPLTAGAEHAPLPGAMVVDYSPAMRAKLGAYVVRHGQAADRSLLTAAPHARIAARDVEEVPAAAPGSASAADAAAAAAGGTPP